MIRRADDVLNAYAIINISITSLLTFLQATVNWLAISKAECNYSKVFYNKYVLDSANLMYKKLR